MGRKYIFHDSRELYFVIFNNLNRIFTDAFASSEGIGVYYCLPPILFVS